MHKVGFSLINALNAPFYGVDKLDYNGMHQMENEGFFLSLEQWFPAF